MPDTESDIPEAKSPETLPPHQTDDGSDQKTFVDPLLAKNNASSSSTNKHSPPPPPTPEFAPNHGIAFTHDLRTNKPELTQKDKIAPYDPVKVDHKLEVINITKGEYDRLRVNEDLNFVAVEFPASEIPKSEALAIMEVFRGILNIQSPKASAQAIAATPIEVSGKNGSSSSSSKHRPLFHVFIALIIVVGGIAFWKSYWPKSQFNSSAKSSININNQGRFYNVGFDAWQQALPQTMKLMTKSAIWITSTPFDPYTWKTLGIYRAKGFDVRVIAIGNSFPAQELSRYARLNRISTFHLEVAIGDAQICSLLIDKTSVLEASAISVHFSNNSDDADTLIKFITNKMNQNVKTIYKSTPNK